MARMECAGVARGRHEDSDDDAARESTRTVTMGWGESGERWVRGAGRRTVTMVVVLLLDLRPSLICDLLPRSCLLYESERAREGEGEGPTVNEGVVAWGKRAPLEEAVRGGSCADKSWSGDGGWVPQCDNARGVA